MSNIESVTPEAQFETTASVIKYYWKDKRGFYRTDVHQIIPEGSYEISEECYNNLLQACDGHHIVVTSEDGSPIVAEVLPDAEAIKKNVAEARLKEMLREKELNHVCELIADDDDVSVLEVAPAFPVWKGGMHYTKGRILNHNGKVYRTLIEVDSRENQPPDSTDQAKIYRLVEPDQHTQV